MDSNIPSKPAYGVFISQLTKSISVAKLFSAYIPFAFGLSLITVRGLKLNSDSWARLIIILWLYTSSEETLCTCKIKLFGAMGIKFHFYKEKMKRVDS